MDVLYFLNYCVHHAVCAGVCEAGADAVGWWCAGPSAVKRAHASCHKHHLGRHVLYDPACVTAYPSCNNIHHLSSWKISI